MAFNLKVLPGVCQEKLIQTLKHLNFKISNILKKEITISHSILVSNDVKCEIKELVPI